jgi:class 3 adenylate cyclase
VTSHRPDLVPAYLVSDPGPDEVRYPVVDRMYIGRECVGIDESRRIVIDDPQVSRNHCEIHLDLDRDRAWVVDLSRNGTWINGDRVTRASPTPIRPGDTVAIADHVFEFQSNRFAAPFGVTKESVTMVRLNVTNMVMVVGDIVGFSTISQATDPIVVARSVQRLWDELADLLRKHRGILNHYAGDAIYAVWDPSRVPNAVEHAADFALEADRHVHLINSALELRDRDGRPITMGWSVVLGQAAVTSMTRNDAVIGDATNLAFRLSGIAGRDGRASVIMTSTARGVVGETYRFGPPEEVNTKGRSGTVLIYPVFGRR